MDNSQKPSFEIPKNIEAQPHKTVGDELDPNLELEGTREILPAPAMQQPASVSQSSVPVTVQSQSDFTISQVVSSIQSDDSHIIADDVDVIEKEWVERAKKIISLTSNDPYVEVKELGKLKATYMKKRFNKDIPLANDGVS